MGLGRAVRGYRGRGLTCPRLIPSDVSGTGHGGKTHAFDTPPAYRGRTATIRVARGTTTRCPPATSYRRADYINFQLTVRAV